MAQTILFGNGCYLEIEEILKKEGVKNLLLVSGNSFKKTEIYKHIMGLSVNIFEFSGFSPNPKYEEALDGTKVFDENMCTAILAAGGGSALDTAKCIKTFSKRNKEEKKIPLITIPTTAGTGSESTQYAVFYRNGQKDSLASGLVMPEYALLIPCLLATLPEYQKKCTLLDALCQAAESFWSVNSTDESRRIAGEAIEKLVPNIYKYCCDNDDSVLDDIMLGSNLAGQAIALTATTAPHAMSYKLTTTYGIPHGLGVGLTFPKVLRYMAEGKGECKDSRGREFVDNILLELAHLFGKDTPLSLADWFEEMLKKLGLSAPERTEQETEMLAASVNPERLINNPVKLDFEALYDMYAAL